MIHHPLTRGLRIVLLALATAAVLLYLYIAISRIAYPFDLEWLEGAAASNTLRAMNGLPLYVQPTLDFVPGVCTPLYFYLCVLPMRLLGPSFLPLRLVSLLFSLGVLALLFALARRETGRASGGLLAVGFFAATFGFCGAWFDLARVDSVFLFFLLLGIWLVRGGRSSRSAVAAGMAAALAFYTRQAALALYLPLIIWSAGAWRRRALWFGGTALVLIGGVFLLLDALHQGWFRYFTVTLPAMDLRSTGMLLRFWWEDLLFNVPVAVASAAAYFVLSFSRGASGPPRYAWFWFCAGGGLVGLSWLARVHDGGGRNVLMPAVAFLALALPLGLEAADRALRRRGHAWHRGVMGAAYLLVIVQFLMLALHPTQGLLPADRWIPTAEDRAAGEAMVDLIAGFEGPVFIPHHCFLPVSAGKRYCGSLGAMRPILQGREDGRQREFVIEGILALRRHKFDAVILDRERVLHFGEALGLYYRQEPGLLIGREDLFRTVTGMPAQPRHLYLPRTE